MKASTKQSQKHLTLLLYKTWETKKESKAHVITFLKDVLEIENADDMILPDVHRLPANKINKHRNMDETTKCRSIIFKLATVEDRNKILGQLKLLKQYNAEKAKRFQCRFIFRERCNFNERL